MHRALRQLLRHVLSQQLTSATKTSISLPRCSMSSSIQHTRGYSTESEAADSPDNRGQQLLQYWHALLGNSDGQHVADPQAKHLKTRWKTTDIRDLLHTAIRLRHGRVSGILPEQLLSTFMQVYHSAMGPSDRVKLFQVLCKDFGVQGVRQLLHDLQLCTLPKGQPKIIAESQP